MAKEKKDQVVKTQKGGKTYYSLEFERGIWFNPLAGPQTFDGVFLKTFGTDSKFKNTRSGSEYFGKNTKGNYSFRMDKQGVLNFSETGGLFQAFLDDLVPGDRVHFSFIGLKRASDGEMMPKSIKTKEQLIKWRGGKKEPAYPVWGKDCYKSSK